MQSQVYVRRQVKEVAGVSVSSTMRAYQIGPFSTGLQGGLLCVYM